MPIKLNRKRKISDISGRVKSIACIGCAIQTGEIESPGGRIAISKFFEAHQDYEIPIPGFIILASKKHLQSVDELKPAEQEDFIKFLCKLRKGLRKALNVSVIYLIQEEDTSHHFHVWMFPRYPWMEKKFGRKIQSVRPIMEYARKNLKTHNNLRKVDAATQKLKQFFSNPK